MGRLQEMTRFVAVVDAGSFAGATNANASNLSGEHHPLKSDTGDHHDGAGVQAHHGNPAPKAMHPHGDLQATSRKPRTGSNRARPREWQAPRA